MHRTNIYLDERQVVALDTLARRRGLTRATIVRGFVDQGLESVAADVEQDLAAIDDSFGALADEPDDVVDDMTREGDGEREAHLARVWRS